MPKNIAKIRHRSLVVACADLHGGGGESATQALPSFPACAQSGGNFYVTSYYLRLDLGGLWPVGRAEVGPVFS